MSLPDWLTERLASPPAAGAGIHAWLFSVARQLHAHMSADAIGAVLRAATVNCGRRVTAREIRDAVNNSQAVAWVPRPRESATLKRSGGRMAAAPVEQPSETRWPKSCPVTRRLRVADAKAEGVGGLADLWEVSPVRPEGVTADDWLDVLLPGAEWLCLAPDHPGSARSRRREKWSFGPADECGLVVPSPMAGPSGNGLDGRRSHRCLDNTGPRRWLVIEFDKLEDGKTPMPIDDQAALHWHFRESAIAAGWPRLGLCVHSGGKSLHGWYGPVADEEKARELMGYAVSLGADPATWNRCQLVRLPGGSRTVKPVMGNHITLPDGWEQPGSRVRLEVFYCDPPNLLQRERSEGGGVASATDIQRAAA